MGVGEAVSEKLEVRILQNIRHLRLNDLQLNANTLVIRPATKGDGMLAGVRILEGYNCDSLAPPYQLAKHVLTRRIREDELVAVTLAPSMGTVYIGNETYSFVKTPTFADITTTIEHDPQKSEDFYLKLNSILR